MRPNEFDKETLKKIQELVEVNFGMRDELYAAAKSLDNKDHERVCHRLAEYLGGHATHLQQLLISSGFDPAQPLDIDEIVNVLFDSIKKQCGTPGVLEAAEEAQRDLKHGYDRVIKESSPEEAKELLRSQRDQVEFTEQVLRSIKQSEVDSDKPHKESD